MFSWATPIIAFTTTTTNIIIVSVNPSPCATPTTPEIIAEIIRIVTILVIAKVAIKIYSNAILNYGTKMSLKDIIKVYKDKNN